MNDRRTVHIVIISIAVLTLALLVLCALLAFQDLPFNEFATMAGVGLGSLASMLARWHGQSPGPE